MYMLNCTNVMSHSLWLTKQNRDRGPRTATTINSYFKLNYQYARVEYSFNTYNVEEMHTLDWGINKIVCYYNEQCYTK